jgi:hypothetical protein
LKALFRVPRLSSTNMKCQIQQGIRMGRYPVQYVERSHRCTVSEVHSASQQARRGLNYDNQERCINIEQRQSSTEIYQAHTDGRWRHVQLYPYSSPALDATSLPLNPGTGSVPTVLYRKVGGPGKSRP